MKNNKHSIIYVNVPKDTTEVLTTQRKSNFGSWIKNILGWKLFIPVSCQISYHRATV